MGTVGTTWGSCPTPAGTDWTNCEEEVQPVCQEFSCLDIYGWEAPEGTVGFTLPSTYTDDAGAVWSVAHNGTVKYEDHPSGGLDPTTVWAGLTQTGTTITFSLDTRKHPPPPDVAMLLFGTDVWQRNASMTIEVKAFGAHVQIQQVGTYVTVYDMNASAIVFDETGGCLQDWLFILGSTVFEAPEADQPVLYIFADTECTTAALLARSGDPCVTELTYTVVPDPEDTVTALICCPQILCPGAG